MKYALIRKGAARWPVRAQCCALGVSPSGYYQSLRREPGPRAQANAELLTKIRKLHRRDKHLGSPRICGRLRAAGEACSRHRVARLMRGAGLRGRCRRKFVVTTQADPQLAPAPNLLARDFAPGGAFVVTADITHLQSSQGKCYLAVVLAVYSRRVLGFSLGASLDESLTLAAMQMALKRGRLPAGTLHHSDRGKQYAGTAYCNLLRLNGLEQSMSRTGDCFDNAVTESFFATLKFELELKHLGRLVSREQLAQAVSAYIDTYYNRQRPHSTLGNMTPAAYERLIPVASLTVH